MTNVLVATEKTQGWRKSDFCHVPEGEIVGFGFECDTDRDNIDGTCGCRRSMSGLECLTATTTMEVIDIPAFDANALAVLIEASLEVGGWIELMGSAEARQLAGQQAAELLKAAAHFPVGSIIEKRGSRFHKRMDGTEPEDAARNLFELGL